ncbi:MAG: 16S rRNA (cytosine(967)-C(5))-methyltransferase RsmB [Armatimonadetes bacterium]|nr:16S rRNA (cytosine(967)-C(5))-methyltransferase RsmB [Armatimonadota bacterium]
MGIAREIALQVLLRTAQGKGQPGLLLSAEFTKHAPEESVVDRSFAQELVLGTLRFRNALDWAISRHCRHSLPTLPSAILQILRLGAYQILYLDRVPDSASVFSSVELTKKYGHPGTVKLVNAVLQSLVRGRDRIPWPDQSDMLHHLVIVQSHPEWLVRRWLDRFGPEEALALCRWNNRVPIFSLRVNTLKCPVTEYERLLSEKGITCHRSEVCLEGIVLDKAAKVESLPGYEEGLFVVQSEGAMLVSRILDPCPGEKILDFCSAPGGKTSHMAQLMGDRGEITAHDVSSMRLRLVKDAVRRLGVRSVKICETQASLEPFYDRVLVDAPCSATGILQRRPDAKWSKRPEVLAENGRLEREILEKGASLLRVGGVMVYSTCSTEPEENELVMDSFCEAHPEFVPDSFEAALPASLREKGGVSGVLQILPQRDSLDGFFVAKMRKV